MTDTTDTAGTTGAVATSRDWRLRDEREFLLRSIEDADREHEAGDLAEDDYRLLRDRDARRLAEVEAALSATEPEASLAGAAPADRSGRDRPLVGGGGVADGGGAADGSRRSEPGEEDSVSRTDDQSRNVVHGRWRRRWRRRRLLAIGGAALVAAGAVLLVVDVTSPRLPGQDATGSIDLNTAQQIERQLAQAQTLVREHHPTRALEVYGQVLAEDPKDPVALAEWGWLDWQAATALKKATLAAEGASALVEAVKVDPHLFPAQYYLGTVLFQEGDPAKAVVHYAAFLAAHPTRAWIEKAAPTIRAAYGAAHDPLPAGVPAKG